MPDKPTFGRYSEIPYEQMTPGGVGQVVENRRGASASSAVKS
jgi:hypothetical protein